jgi:lipid-A-disaccharide synthase
MSVSGGVCIIAGEASGDAQIAPVIAELRDVLENAGAHGVAFWGAAGPKMRELGVEPIVRVEDIAVMGFTEIVPAYFRIQDAYQKLLNEVETRNPLAVILVDYAGFNLRFAKDVFQRGGTVVYHVPPKVWARSYGRVSQLRDYTHLVTAILPFEERLLRSEGINARFVGNPLCDSVRDFRTSHSGEKVVSSDTVNIAVLPGSRKAELERLIPLYVQALFELEKRLSKKVMAKIPVASTLSNDYVLRLLARSAASCQIPQEWVQEHIGLEGSGVYPVLASADYCWVCSGTAALETAFFEVPNAVAYRMSWPSALLMKALMNVHWVSLGNLCAGRELVPEFLQHRATVENLVNHAYGMLTNASARNLMRAELHELERQFPGNAARVAANEICKTILSHLMPADDKFRKHAETRSQILSGALR